MSDKLIQFLLTQGNAISVVGVTLVFAGLLLLSLHKGWVVLGRYHTSLASELDAKSKLLIEVNEKLVEQRVINERVSATLEHLRERLADSLRHVSELERDLVRAEAWRDAQQATRKRVSS